MADTSAAIKTWMDRIDEAQKQKAEWESKYRVPVCRAALTGQQRAPEDVKDENGEEKIIINRILPAVRAAMPSLYFSYPYVRINASPSRADTPGSRIEERAQLLQDTVNTLIRDPYCGFKDASYLAIKEAWWAFGCVEVGYEAKFPENPYGKKPPLKEDADTEIDSTAPDEQPDSPLAAALGPAPIDDVDQGLVPPDEERFFVRRIPARQVLVSKKEDALVSGLDWVGYWEWLPLEDVKRAKAYKNTRDLTASGSEKKEGDDACGNETMVKLYRIWDLRTNTRYVLADNYEKYLLKERFERLPLFFMRFEVMPDHFYPIPPIFNMLVPQKDYNDSRDMLRVLRKAIVPRYTYDENAVKPDQLERFEDGSIGTYIPVQNGNPSPINPVNQPSMNENAIRTLTLSQQEFTELSGVSAQARQISSSDTATQASIIAQRENIQDSFDRQQVATFLGDIAKEILLLAIEKMILPKWILANSDPYSPYFAQDALNIAELYKEITLEDLQAADADLRWAVSVDMESMSPVSEQQKQATWNQVLATLANPAIAKILALSPELLKQTLNLNGIKSAKEQAMIGDALQKLAAMEMQMAQQAAMRGQAAAPKGVSPMPGQGGPQPGVPQQAPQPAPPMATAA